VKLKIGARTLTADLERVAAVRAALPDTELRADANGAWTPTVARRALSQVATHDLAYVEQPLPAAGSDGNATDDEAADLAAHAALRGAGTGTPIALDESLAHHPVERVLDSGAADVLVLKPMALGGPDRALAAARTARRAGVTPVVTTTIDGAVARAAAVHVAAAIPKVPPCGLATGDRLAADLLDPDPVPVSAGAIRVPTGPGALGATARDAADPS
jgi:L-alanine-DL-glutamate epimerase-like enolase superfamily enzyme